MASRRKPKTHVTDDELRECMRIVAGLVRDLGDIYVPLYLRFERELEARQERKKTMERILEVAGEK